MRIPTYELRRGDAVATRKVFGEYVTTAAPGAQGVWRTIDDIALQPVDTKAQNDRLIFFTDGTKAATRRSAYWTRKEA